MIVTNKAQQQSIRYVVDTDRCCGCKRCIRRCQENVWQWDEEHGHAYPKYPDECVLVRRAPGTLTLVISPTCYEQYAYT